MAKQQPRSGFVWFVLCFGLAGLFHRTVPAEVWPEDDWLGLVLVNTLLIALTFFPKMVSARPARPFLRWGPTGVWLARVGVAAGVLQLVFARRNFASAYVVSVSYYLVIWALLGTEKLILRSKPVAFGPPTISMEDWLAAIVKICRRIDYWDDSEALRCEVFEKLQSQACLEQYRGSLDPDLLQATMHFVRSVGSRNVKSSAKEMVVAYRRSRPRSV